MYQSDVHNTFIIIHQIKNLMTDVNDSEQSLKMKNQYARKNSS